jgi:hypothetical protein
MASAVMEEYGLLMAYMALGMGAVLPIYFGSVGTLKYGKAVKSRRGSRNRSVSTST